MEERHQLFKYRGNEPDDWCMVHGGVIWELAIETGCTIGRALSRGIFLGTTRTKYVYFIRREDHDAIQTLRKAADPKCADKIMLGPGAFVFPGDHPSIEIWK